MPKNNSEFWGELSGSIARKAKDLGEKAELIYETQKLRGRISGEERVIQKIKADLGNILYQRYLEGQELSEEQESLCEQIEQHENCIERYKKKMSSIKKKKICPSCKQAVDASVSFCPYCGVACPDVEDGEEISQSDVVSEGTYGEETKEEKIQTEEAEQEETAETEETAEILEDDTKEQ